MSVLFCRDRLPPEVDQGVRFDGEDHAGIHLLGGEGDIEDDFLHEDGVGIVVVLTEGGIEEGTMGGVTLIDLGLGLLIGGMIGGDGVRVIVVILVGVRRLSGEEVGLEVVVHPRREHGIGVSAVVVVAVLEMMWF